VLIWVFIYAGLFGFGLGLWFTDHHLATGATLMAVGAVLVAAGALLLWLRSRRP
jgi:hypothetical protein